MINAWVYALFFSFVLAGFPLAILSSVAFDVSSRFVTIPFRLVMVSMAALIIGVGMVISWQRYRGILLVAFFTFWVLYVLRLMNDCFWMPSPTLRLPPEEYAQMAIGVSLLPCLPFIFQPTAAGLRRTFYFTYILLGVFGLVVAIFYGPLLGTDFFRLGEDTRVGDYRGINPLSISGPSTLLFVYSLLQLDDVSRNTRSRLFVLVVGVGLSLPGILLGSSRSSIATVLFCLSLLALARIRNHPKTVLGLALAFIVISPLVAVLADDLGSGLVKRFMGISTSVSSGDMSSDRLVIWEATIRDYLESPVFGAGLIPRVANFAHNVVLDAFHATGIMGGGFFTIFVIGCCMKSWFLIKNHREYSWIGISYYYYFSESMYHGNLYLNAGFWSFSMAVLGCSAAAEGKQIGLRRSAWLTRIGKHADRQIYRTRPAPDPSKHNGA